MTNPHVPDLQLDRISHRYRAGGPLILRDISLRVRGGECVALVGPSGCGKSTLLDLIAGMSRASEGTVRLGEQQVQAPSSRCVLMFQQPLLYPWMTVFDNAALALRLAGRSAEAPAVVGRLLDMVKLGDYAAVNAQDLSGGQQQRVALARALAADPKLLLLDEPFSALDAFVRADLQRAIRSIARCLGLTLIVVTHDIDEAVRMADRALVMTPNPGRIVADLCFNLPEDREREGMDVAFEKARLMAALGEMTQAPHPSDFHEI